MVLGAALLCVLVWASVASLAVYLGDVPAFLLLGTVLLIGGLPGLFRPRLSFSHWKAIWVGTVGFYLYHFFLFQGYRLAPPIHVNVINYLWPSLIVLMGPLFDRSMTLSKKNILGLLIGFSGVTFLILGQDAAGTGEYPNRLAGYLCGFLAAISWPIYTWMTRLMGERTSSWNVSAMCLIAGALSLLSHFLFEPGFPIFDLPKSKKLMLLAMGMGPFGVGFYAWDYCMKRGDPKVIGSISYFIPVLSNAVLAWTLGVPVTARLALAVISVFLGAILASRPTSQTT